MWKKFTNNIDTNTMLIMGATWVLLITSSQSGIAFAYPLDPGESSVITSVDRGDPAK
jgi:hypothetical protein